MATDVTSDDVWASSPALLMKRIRVYARNGDYIHQTDVASIAVTIYAEDNTTVYSAALVPNVVIFDALQINPVFWPFDVIGYNFAWLMPTGVLPSAGEWEVTVVLTLTDGSLIPLVWDLLAKGVP